VNRPRDGRTVRTLVVDNYVIPAGGHPDEGHAEDHMLRTTRKSWVDAPNSLGMTPREAAEAGGDARRDLAALLDDMQWYNDRSPKRANGCNGLTRPHPDGLTWTHRLWMRDRGPGRSSRRRAVAARAERFNGGNEPHGAFR
jgi:hypothetical protein